VNTEKIKVLIADDNKDFCDILSEYLEKQPDIEIVGIAKDGIQALDYIEKKLPDVLVLDIIMPHLDGLGVLERLNTWNLQKFPKIIILSAVGQDKITQRAITLGADYYVVKPFDMEVFTKRVRQLVSGSTGVVERRKNTTQNVDIVSAGNTLGCNNIGKEFSHGYDFLFEKLDSKL